MTQLSNVDSKKRRRLGELLQQLQADKAEDATLKPSQPPIESPAEGAEVAETVTKGLPAVPAAAGAIVQLLARIAPALPSVAHHSDLMQNWDVLFNAVKSKLCHAVNVTPADTEPSADERRAAAHLVQTVVLECVQGLEQLHKALLHERGESARRDLPPVVQAIAVG